MQQAWAIRALPSHSDLPSHSLSSQFVRILEASPEAFIHLGFHLTPIQALGRHEDCRVDASHWRGWKCPTLGSRHCSTHRVGAEGKHLALDLG